MKMSQMFPSKYLGKDDVSSPFTATIADVRMEKLKSDGEDEVKPVLHFVDDQVKPMILNKINSMTLEAAYGDDSDLWRAKPIEIYVDKGVMFGGKMIGGVRLRLPQGFNLQPRANGHATPPAKVFTFDQAVAELANVGMSRDDLIAKIKGQGFTGWNSVRDTPTVQAMLEGGPVSEEIPF